MPIYDQGSSGGNYNAPGAGFVGGPPAAPTKPKKPKPAPTPAPVSGADIGLLVGGGGAVTPSIGAGAGAGALIGTTGGTSAATPGGGRVIGWDDAPAPPSGGGGKVIGWDDGPGYAPPVAPAPPTQFDLDPQVMINKLLEQLGIGTIDADLKAQRERAIIGWGDPALAAMAGFGIDPQAGVFAQQNYLSGNAGLAKINKQHDLNSRGIVNKLAGRGLLRSGDLGYQTGEENQAYASNQYEGRQKILDYLTQIAQQAQDRRNALRQSVIQSVMAAYQNLGQNPQAYASLYGG